MDINAVAEVLHGERRRLVHQLAELGADETGELTGAVEFGDGFADAAATTAERTEILGIADNAKVMLDDVDAALARVENGTYGTCEECGKEIGAARMEFRPTSKFCFDCKSKR